jgi:hypothetical protein
MKRQLIYLGEEDQTSNARETEKTNLKQMDWLLRERATYVN